MKKVFVIIIDLISNLCLIPLFFLKIIHEVAAISGKDVNGNLITYKQDYYYSIIDNLKYDSMLFINISFSLILLSIFLSILSLFFKKKTLIIICHIVSILSLLFFLFLYFLARLNARVY